MATTLTQSSIWQYNLPVAVATWAALGGAESGDSLAGMGFSDRSVQVSGTFGGATVVIQGSNDGTNWFTLTDTLGNNLSFTSAGLKQILDACLYMRPSASGGTGSSISVIIAMTGMPR